MNNQQYLLSFIRAQDIKINKELDYNFHIAVISDEEYYKFLDFEEKKLDGTIAICGIVVKVEFELHAGNGANIICLDFHSLIKKNKNA
jgi:hypothetical protein